MANKSNWKGRERQVAEFFGTVRKPGSGGYHPNESSDTNHENLYIEHKQRATHTVMSLLRETRKKAKKEQKTPIVTLSEKNKTGFAIVVHNTDLDKFIEEYLQSCR